MDMKEALEKIRDGYGPNHGSKYCRDIALEAISSSPDAGGDGVRWRHKKRGSTYTEVGRGTMQIAAETNLQDDEPVVIYRSDDDGSLWARTVGEFEDGRFEALRREAPACSGVAKEAFSSIFANLEEDDPDVVIASRAIAKHGMGRSWDDFLPSNVHDIDQSDLIEYARAAVAALRGAHRG